MRTLEALADQISDLVVAIGSGRVTCSTEDIVTARVVVGPIDPGDREAEDRIAAMRLEFVDNVLHVTEPKDTRRSVVNSGHSSIQAGVVYGNVVVTDGRVTTSGNVSLGPGIAVNVVLPYGAAVEVDSTMAAVTLHGHYRRAAVTTRHGDVTINSVEHAGVGTNQGDIRIGTSGGGRYRTNHGNIRVAAVTGEHHLTTKQGDIRVGNATGEIDATTNMGNIEVTAIGWGNADLRTNMGDIDVVRAFGVTDFRVKARTSMGSVRGV